MSGAWHSRFRGFVTGVVLLAAGPAQAQSTALLGKLRVHDPAAPGDARAELSACEAHACSRLGPLTLLVATLDLAEGKAQAARTRLEAHPLKGLLGPYAEYYRGQAAFYTQDFVAAAAAFARAADEGPPQLLSRARAREAEAYLEAGQPDAALPLLEDVLAQSPNADLLLARGRARKAQGDVQGALSDFHALLVHHPLSPASAAAVTEAQGLPGGAPKLTLEERLSRAKAFLEAGAFPSAEAELAGIEHEKLAKGKPALAKLALGREALAFAQGQDAVAERALKDALDGPPPTAAEALLLRARRKMKGNGPHPIAQQLMADLERRYPKEPAAEEAGYFTGWLLLQEERYNEAAAAFEQFELHHPKARKRDEAGWYRAYALLRAQRWEDARGVLEAFSQRFPRSPLLAQARYWALRSRQMLGQRDVAEGYVDLIEQNPGSFYALLGAERLRELGRVPPASFPAPPKLRAAKELPELALARALDAAGLQRDAAEEIQRRVASVHSVPAALELASALSSLEEPGAAYSLAARLLWGAAFTQRMPEALAFFYPRAYGATLEQDARVQGVSPYLLWSIMRRESAFRPDLMSGANARGLMQLIPPTAVAIAKARHEEPPAPDALYSPALNLDLAAWYVAALVKRFVHPVLVAAAYNAGPGVVAHWATQNGQLPVDLFVEAIPYRETRGYVKQVVADAWLYQSFYGAGGETSRLALRMPTVPAEGIDF